MDENRNMFGVGYFIGAFFGVIITVLFPQGALMSMFAMFMGVVFMYYRMVQQDKKAKELKEELKNGEY